MLGGKCHIRHCVADFIPTWSKNVFGFSDRSANGCPYCYFLKPRRQRQRSEACFCWVVRWSFFFCLVNSEQHKSIWTVRRPKQKRQGSITRVWMLHKKLFCTSRARFDCKTTSNDDEPTLVLANIPTHTATHTCYESCRLGPNRPNRNKTPRQWFAPCGTNSRSSTVEPLIVLPVVCSVLWCLSARVLPTHAQRPNDRHQSERATVSSPVPPRATTTTELFQTGIRYSGVSKARQTGKLLGTWVRTIGLILSKLQPMSAARHYSSHYCTIQHHSEEVGG